MTEKIKIIPLKGVVEVNRHKVYFEAMESEHWDKLPTLNDWWIEGIVSAISGWSLPAKAKCEFELQHEGAIHSAIRDYCRKTKEESDYERGIRKYWGE